MREYAFMKNMRKYTITDMDENHQNTKSYTYDRNVRTMPHQKDAFAQSVADVETDEP